MIALLAMASAAPADLGKCTSTECLLDDEQKATVSLLQTNMHVQSLNSGDLPFADSAESREEVMLVEADGDEEDDHGGHDHGLPFADPLDHDEDAMLEEAGTVTVERIPVPGMQLLTVEGADDPDQCKARLLRFDQLGVQNLVTAGNDPLFPPIESSIAPPGTNCGDSAAGISESCAKFNHWKTFQQVADKTSNPFKVFGPSGTQFGDIGQGLLGSCYFLAALAATANEHPQIIEDMFVERASWANNIFKTKWLVNGKETVVSVDNMIPADDAGTFFAKQSATGEFWPVILAKAWAKIYGSFNAIEGGVPGNVVAAITRAPVTYNHHNKISPEALFKLLLDATQAKFPMTAGTSSNAPKYGLALGHAYAILSAFTHPTYGHVVKMFNPWRSDKYSGAVPNTVEVNGPQTGVFTIKLAEFHDAFSGSEIAKVRSGYVATSRTIATGQASAMLVSVSNPGQFFASLTWPGARMMEPCHLSGPKGMVVAANKNSIGQKSQMLPRISNYNSLTTQVENAQGGQYEALANLEFPPTVTVDNKEVPAVAVPQVQFTVYAPGVAEIVPAVAIDVASELFGPMKDSQPCEFIQIPGRGTYKRDSTQLSPSGVPTYWSLDKQRFVYFPTLPANPQDEWYEVAASSWQKVLAGELWSSSKVAKNDLVCACQDLATGVGGFGVTIPCSRVSGANIMYGNVQCTGQTTSPKVETSCPQTCGICPWGAAEVAAQAAAQAEAKAAAEAAAAAKAAKDAADAQAKAGAIDSAAPCEFVQIPGKGTFQKDAGQLSPSGIKTYWSLDKKTLAYLPDVSGNDWYVVPAQYWPQVQQKKWYKSSTVPKSQISACACDDAATGVGGFGVTIPCSRVSGSNIMYGNVQCTGQAPSPTVQTYCPKTCGICPLSAAEAEAAAAAKAAAAAAKAACQDSTTYKDPQWGELCSAWVGYKCSGFAFTEALETNCPKACNKCTA